MVAVQSQCIRAPVDWGTPRKLSAVPLLRMPTSFTNHLSPWRSVHTFLYFTTMPPSSQPVDQVGELAASRRRKFFLSSCLGRLSNAMKLAPRSSKTKAMHDAAWRSLKPRSFSKLKKSAQASDPAAQPKKKRKVLSKQGGSKSSGLVLRAHTDGCTVLRYP